MKLTYKEVNWLAMTREERRTQARIILATLLGLPVNTVRITSSGDRDAKQYTVTDHSTGEGQQVASFKLKRLPGCCGVAVSYNAKVTENYRGKGVGQFLSFWRLVQAWLLEYTSVICTTISQNEPQKHILRKLGWRTVGQFDNMRSENDVIVWAFNLPELSENAISDEVEEEPLSHVYPAYLDVNDKVFAEQEVVRNIIPPGPRPIVGMTGRIPAIVYRERMPKMNKFQEMICKLCRISY